jgi:PEGA domain
VISDKSLEALDTQAFGHAAVGGRIFREVMMRTFLLATVASLTGCATIISGTHQEVKINSLPAGAAVTVDGAPRGVTPVVLKLSRRPSHTLTLQKDGFQPESCIINSGFNGWFLGNILLGGVIGMAVDGIDGASSKLEVPDNGYFTLVPEHSPSPGVTSTHGPSGIAVVKNH